MTSESLGIYKAQIDTPYGYFLVAVVSTGNCARQDILSAAHGELNCHWGMIKIKNEVTKSNSRIFAKMWPIKNCVSNDKYWGYIKRDKK